MELENLKLSDLLKFVNLFNKQKNAEFDTPVINKLCVIRTYSAGVHIGTPTYIKDTTALIKNARRLWKWEGAFTLSEVATKGINGGRISCVVPEILLTEAIEFIPCNPDAAKTYELFYEQ